MPLSLIVHGGAWDIPVEIQQAHKDGCKAAVIAAFEALQHGGSALDAVEKAVMMLEDNPVFDAGVGSHLNQAGKVQLDAGIADGELLRIGAVIGVERLKNPVGVARRLLLDERYHVMVGQGAEDYAIEQGFILCKPDALIVEREWQLWETAINSKKKPTIDDEFKSKDRGTVGAVAFDQNGNIAAATSTGGTLFKPVGRVGDSPLPGCGYFADNRLGGASSTGHGESIMRVQLASSAAHFCTQLQAPAAAKAAINMLENRVDGLGGIILIDQAGRIGLAHNTPHLAYAYVTDEMNKIVVGI